MGKKKTRKPEPKWVQLLKLAEASTRKSADRKLRLLACACCRNVWDEITHPAIREAVEVAEKWADGLANKYQLTSAELACDELIDIIEHAELGGNVTIDLGASAAEAVCRYLMETHLISDNAICALITEIFGDLNHTPIINKEWVSWNDNSVRNLAQSIYDRRAFTELSNLAKMLEQSTCSDELLLGHLYSKDICHVLGCWALDLIQGKRIYGKATIVVRVEEWD